MRLTDGIGAGVNLSVQGTRDARLAAANARTAVNDTVNVVNDVRKKIGDTRELTKIATTGSLAKGLGIAGVASAVAGFGMAAKKGDINGMIGSLSDLASSMTATLDVFKKFPGAVELLKKVGGPVAIVGGITSAIGTLKDMQKNGVDPGKLAKLGSNVLTSVAGVAMMIPGGQVVAAAAGAASAALSLGSLAYKYKDEIAGAAKGAANWVGDKAGDVGNAISGGAKKAWNSLFGG